MKPYIKKLDSKYLLFFKDEYGNLYGGIRSFTSWNKALRYGIKNCSYSK